MPSSVEAFGSIPQGGLSQILQELTSAHINESWKGEEMIDYSIWLVFVLGIIVGGVLFSKDFRQKFFTGFRKFLAGVGRSNMGRSMSGASRPRTETRNTLAQRNAYEPAPKTKPKIIDCPTCDGTGVVEEKLAPLMKGAPGTREKWITCGTCEGSGRVYEK